MLLAGFAVLIAAHMLASPVVIGFAGPTLVLLLLAGLIWRQIPTVVYRFWFAANKRFARVAQLYIAALIHFVVFTAAKGADTALQLSEVNGSMWRSHPARSAELGQPERNSQGWVAEFLRNAKTPERRWWLFLLPLLLLLASFRSGKASDEVPENIYTLF